MLRNMGFNCSVLTVLEIGDPGFPKQLNVIEKLEGRTPHEHRTTTGHMEQGLAEEVGPSSPEYQI
jgi:hypothetical protein